MKKPSLLLLSAFAGVNSAGAKAIRIFLLTFILCWISSISNAQVVVTSTADTDVCYTSAVGGSAPLCTTLGNITITETLPGDFSTGQDIFTLSVPAGWQFCTAPPVTMSAAAGGDVAPVAGSINYAFTSSTILSVTVSALGNTRPDQITISGLQVQPTSTVPNILYIYPTSVSGVNGITVGPTGTNFGFLRVIPGTITGLTSHCVGDVDNYATGLVPGGTWSVSSSSKASVDAFGNVTFGPASGIDTVIYTLAGCSAYLQITVNPQPRHSVFTNAYVTTVPNNILTNGVCAWFDSFYVKNPDSLGFFSTGGVTGTGYATFFGTAPTGHGVVHANAPGIDYITFTKPGTGCSVTDTFVVNQLPNVITGNDTICVGNSTLLGNTTTPGAWSVSNTTASILPSGLVTGLVAGRDTVIYTLPTGCKRDTIVIVNPLPGAITGNTSICLGATVTLSSATISGTWSTANTTIIALNPKLPSSVQVTGLSLGTATLTYTLTRTGCFVTTVVTVNPLPSPITANQAAECVNANVIQLSDATSGGTWTASNTNAFVSTTGQVRGDFAGTDTISYTLGTGCAVLFVVTINPLPGPISATDTSFCVGKVATFSDLSPSPGGPPTWTVTPTGVTLPSTGTGVTFGVLGIPPGGVATIKFTLSTGCSVTRTITVNPLPDTISGTHLLCLGQTTTLSDATVGVKWSSSNTTVATIDSTTGFVTTVTTGTVIMKATTSFGCDVSFTMTITPYPNMPLAVGGRTTLCYNDTVTLYDVIAPGGTWTSGNTAIITVNPTTGLATAGNTLPGTATITYTVSSGCDTFITLTVNPITPIYGPNTICQGDSIQLNDATLGGTFRSGGVITSTGATTTAGGIAVAEVTGLRPGVDNTITYTTAFGCKATFTVTVFPTTFIVGADSVCVNDSIKLKLNDTTLTGPGMWSVGNTSVATIDSASGLLTGVASGTVLVINTLRTGCKIYYTVRVNPLPDPITVTSHTVCQGGTVQFSETTPGGRFSLVTPPAFGTIDPITGLYTSIKDSVDTVIYKFPTGCKVSDTVRIFPLLPIYGSDTICVGNTTQLHDTTKLMGGSYTWISDNGPVADIDAATGLVTGYSQGTATITYLLSTGCQATDTIYVNPLPGVISGVDSVCVGATTTFSNTIGGGIWTSGATTIATIDPVTGLITGIAAGTATITYKLVPTGCFVVDSVTVHGLPNPLGGHSYVCIGFSTTLTDATPGGTWTSTDTFVAKVDTFTGVVTSIMPGLDTIFYTLTATGCNAAITFTVFGGPPVVVSTPALICRGASAMVTASGADLGSILGSYTWVPATGLSSTAGPSVVASPTITTTYTVVGTTFFGCKDTVTTTVLVDSLLNHLAVTGPDSICIGTCATLIASGRDGSLFAWTPTVGLSCTICDTTIACPTSTTLYEATAIDRIGCKDSIAKRIVVMPLPVLTAYAEPHEFPIVECRGTPLQLLAFGAWSYEWSPNLFLSCDSCANPVVNDSFNMQYLLTGHTRFGCTDSLKVKVSVLDTNIDLFSHDTDICFGDNAHLFASSHSVNSSLDVPKFLWTPGWFLDDPTSPNPISIMPTQSVAYTVVVTENRCFSDTAVIKVNVQPYPIITISPKSTTEFAGTQRPTIVRVTNTPVRSYVWTPSATVSCDTCDTTFLAPIVNTTYTITVTSIYGCTSDSTVTVNVGCDSRQVFIPNTFTPNGDGMNDRFFISGKGLRSITLFEVYNRWGESVYHAENISPNDAASGWDGTYKGKVLEPDVYMYVINATCALTGEKFIYKGDISLVR